MANSNRHNSDENGHSARFSADIMGNMNALQEMENLIPELKKRDIANMKPDERDEAIEEAERLTIEWVHAFLDETYRIDDFFKTK